MTGTIRRRGPTNMSTLLATVSGEVVNHQHQVLVECESIDPVILMGRRLRAHEAAARLLRHPPQQWHRTAYLLICTSKYSEYIGVVCLSLCGLIRGPRGRTRWARLEI